MGMYATSANELKVYFNTDTFLTFKMHADLHMDLIRWLQVQNRRIALTEKRADKIETAAMDLGLDDDVRFVQLTEQAEALRGQGGDMLNLIVDYVKKACNGWTDYYENADAEARQELLPFDEKNITRIGVLKLKKVMEAFNEHYGLSEQSPGEVKGESLPALSPSVTVAASSPNDTASSAPTAP